MTDRTYRRLTRFAGYTAVHLALVVGLLASPLPPDIAWLIILVLSVPLFLAWGSYQADVAMNPALGEAARTRWRVALWCVPWSMALYWHWYVHPARDGD